MTIQTKKEPQDGRKLANIARSTIIFYIILSKGKTWWYAPCLPPSFYKEWKDLVGFGV